MSQTLQCSKCKTIKSITMFYKNRSRKTGYSSYCKNCDNSIPRNDSYNPTKYIKADGRKKHSRATLRRFYNYPNQCKRRKKKIDFLLTLDQFISLTSALCYYCGQLSPGKNYVGIDRIDSNGNYTVDNCVSCCSICNMMKRTLPIDSFFSHIHKISNLHKL